jgi:LacI family repressor for deo operon, udp, cdd, tsx, nupC, and nupG
MSSKPATIKEIARRLNVSVSTVSRGLHDHPSIGLTTRQKIQKLARELNYEPNQTAIFLQKGSTETIGVILPELSEAFFSTAINAIEEVANQRNYTVLLAQSHDDEELEKKLIEKMRKHRVDGLLISVGKNTSSYQHLENLKQHNIPVVYFDRIPTMANIHYVACNMETGTVAAVNYLLRKGHRSIGLINGPATLLASTERKTGYINALTKNRLKYDPSLVVSCDLTEAGTVIALDELLAGKRNPTAIVTFNDYVALWAIKHARNIGLKVNQHLEFVSYANLPLTNYIEQAPTASVEQFPYLQGQKAADILLDLLQQKKQLHGEQTAFYKIIVESQLVERDQQSASR